MLISDDFTTMALGSGALVGLVCSYLGMFVVLRRIVFVGASLAQAASAGVALSALAHWPPALGAGLAILLGVGVFSHEPAHRRLPREAIVGAAWAAAGAAAVLFLAFAPHGETHMLDLLFGNILGVTPGDIAWLAGAFAVVAAIHVAFAKEFQLVAFDPEMARTLGYRVGAWNFLFFLTLGGAIAVAIRAAGVLLVFAMLVFPPMIGLLASRRWTGACLVSAGAALASVGLGVWASLHWDLPTGSAIVAVAFLGFLLASLLRSLRPD